MTCTYNFQTYTNQCKSDQSGVSVRTAGACGSPTPAPATPAPAQTSMLCVLLLLTSLACRGNNECPGDQFCAFQFGTCGGTGQCIPRPKSDDCDPSVQAAICGCDGKVCSLFFYDELTFPRTTPTNVWLWLALCRSRLLQLVAQRRLQPISPRLTAEPVCFSTNFLVNSHKIVQRTLIALGELFVSSLLTSARVKAVV